MPRPYTLSRISDGDTQVIDQPVRMVSVDTPEKAEYAGLPPPPQAKMDRCRQRLQDGAYQNLPETLRTYLVERLTQDAGPAAHQRRHPTGELIDRYGRCSPTWLLVQRLGQRPAATS